MSDPFWKELVKQERLEEMYEVFHQRPDATEKNTAIRLARFAEARMFNAADRRIVELEDELKKAKQSHDDWLAAVAGAGATR